MDTPSRATTRDLIVILARLMAIWIAMLALVEVGQFVLTALGPSLDDFSLRVLVWGVIYSIWFVAAALLLWWAAPALATRALPHERELAVSDRLGTRELIQAAVIILGIGWVVAALASLTPTLFAVGFERLSTIRADPGEHVSMPGGQWHVTRRLLVSGAVELVLGLALLLRAGPIARLVIRDGRSQPTPEPPDA